MKPFVFKGTFEELKSFIKNSFRSGFFDKDKEYLASCIGSRYSARGFMIEELIKNK